MLQNCASMFTLTQLANRSRLSGKCVVFMAPNVFSIHDKNLQKVRQSQNLVYAHEGDAFNLLLADERYLTAEHVNTRTRYELCLLRFSVYD
jgi:hypothetical protein